MNQHAVVNHFDKPSVLNLLASLVETGSAENNVERLPFTGGFADIHLRSMSFKPFAVGPPLIDAAAIAVFRFLHPEAVEYLDFISALKIDAGIGSLGNDKLDMRLDVAVLPFREKIDRAARLSVDQHALAGLDRKLPGIRLIDGDSASNRPTAGFVV